MPIHPVEELLAYIKKQVSVLRSSYEEAANKVDNADTTGDYFHYEECADKAYNKWNRWLAAMEQLKNVHGL